jgi:hypothetical protein
LTVCIRARVIRRCAELLEEIERKPGANQNVRVGDRPKSWAIRGGPCCEDVTVASEDCRPGCSCPDGRIGGRESRVLISPT